VSRYLAVQADRVRAAMGETLLAENRLSLTYLPGEPPVGATPSAEEVAS
jgi:hypothetical protein